MTHPKPRSVSLERLSKGRYRATNKHGDTLVVGEGGDGTFTPVELLLTAMAACSAIDVDYIVGQPASVGEACVVPAQNSQPFRVI